MLDSQENSQIRELQQENKELRESLEEHQTALELIMSKYREQMTKLLKADQLEREYIAKNCDRSQVRFSPVQHSLNYQLRICLSYKNVDVIHARHCFFGWFLLEQCYVDCNYGCNGLYHHHRDPWAENP